MDKKIESERFSLGRCQFDAQNGVSCWRQILNAPDTAEVLIRDSSGNVLLIQELCATTGSPCYALPHGCKQQGETLAQTTSRIALEEGSKRVWGVKQVCHPYRMAPTYATERFFPVQAYVAGYENILPRPEKGILKIEWLQEKEVLKRIRNQMKHGTPFKDGVEMDGKSILVFLSRFFLDNF